MYSLIFIVTTLKIILEGITIYKVKTKMKIFINLWRTRVKIIGVEEDKSKNRARRAWTGGPDGSVSMGPRKVKPIPCIEHYLK